MSLLILILCIAILVICCITLSRVKRLAFYLRRMPIGVPKKKKTKVVQDLPFPEVEEDEFLDDIF